MPCEIKLVNEFNAWYLKPLGFEMSYPRFETLTELYEYSKGKRKPFIAVLDEIFTEQAQLTCMMCHKVLNAETGNRVFVNPKQKTFRITCYADAWNKVLNQILLTI